MYNGELHHAVKKSTASPPAHLRKSATNQAYRKFVDLQKRRMDITDLFYSNIYLLVADQASALFCSFLEGHVVRLFALTNKFIGLISWKLGSYSTSSDEAFVNS